MVTSNWKLGLASVRVGAIALIIATGNHAVAQIQPELRPEQSVVTPIGAVDQITGGATRGTSLFHSFIQFNVAEGRSTFFIQPTGIENILTRVIGGNPSNILGNIGVTGGNANLFLINPNGITFGPNARLLLNGSFVATTANAITLANGDIFSTDPTAPFPNQLLNVNPNAFFFNQIAAKPITSQARLQVLPQESLLLIGGDVKLEGGILQAPGGRVELASLAGSGNVALNTNGNTLSLSVPPDVARADVSITNSAGINVANGGSGSIAINARNLTISGDSYLTAGRVLSDSDNRPSGDITLKATGTTTLRDRSVILNTIASGSGTGGNVRIDTGQLLIRDGVVGNSSVSPQSRAGNLIINAGQSVEVTSTTDNGKVSINTPIGLFPNLPIGLFTAPATIGGSAGDLTITTGRLLVQGGARLSVGTPNQNPGGNLTIQAFDSVELAGTSANGTPTIVASGTQGSGSSGDVTIDTRRLVVRDGALVVTGTSSQGQGGKLTVRGSESVELLGTADRTFDDASLQALIGASLSPFIGVRPLPSGLITATVGSGNSGDLTIETGRLVIRGGAQASTSTGTSGRGGELQVRAPEIELSGVSPDGFFSSALAIDSRGAGEAGNLRISTRQMTLRDGGQVLASASGTGKAGTLDVNASDSVQVIGTATNGKPSSLFFDTSGSGNAGILRITTGRLLVQNGGRVSAGTTGTGQGGILNVNALESVEVAGTSADGQTPSRLFFDTENAGDAGELQITTPVLRVRDGGQVSARTSGSGRGGILQVTASDSVEVAGTSANGQFASGLYFDTSSAANARGIKIDTGNLVVRDGGQVTVSGTGSGAAGDLDIVANSIFVSDRAKLTATTASGEGGNIRLQVQDSIQMRRNSEISTEASGTGNGGNINIDAGGFVLALLPENSDIVANAFQGRGGNIFATARGVYGFRRFVKVRTPESDFTASSQIGLDGLVEIDLRNELEAIPLPERAERTEITQTCQEVRGKNESRFIITGRGGLPDNPGATLSNDAVWTDLRTPTGVGRNSGEEDSKTRGRRDAENFAFWTSSSQPPIVEANGWVINQQGKVVLTATAPTLTSPSFGQAPAACDASPEGK